VGGMLRECRKKAASHINCLSVGNGLTQHGTMHKTAPRPITTTTVTMPKRR
jgi:hypothetical protein